MVASRVFVGDDEPVIGTTLAAILNVNGFSARAFTGAIEAVAAAQADIPDLLISDVAMPEFSGIELAIRMKMQYPKCKILLFCGQAHTADLLNSTRHQGHQFRLLLKPVFPGELLSEINKIEDEPIRSTRGLHLIR
jgi:DNA-binding NtrC family response regulator